jgi:phenylalanyl-tRNA synthetase beta chain
MKLSLNWLREILPGMRQVTPEDVAAALLRLGYEVEGMQRYGAGLDDVRVVRVLAREPHPRADRLSLVDITDGSVTRRVVCGAPNVVPGMHAAFIAAGGVLPGGMRIESRAIRGVVSDGMLCSEFELGVGEDRSGILSIGDGATPGEPFAPLVSDVVLEIATPPNRFDCLGHRGIARELAVLLGLDFKTERFLSTEVRDRSFFEVKVTSPDLCPRYIAVNLTGVSNAAPLPFAMRRRLTVCGMRSINPLVDISNYVLLEYGHPVHIFDVERLEGGCLSVRRAAPGETILALDGRTYTLDEEVMVIADASRPAAIAGVIGGEHTAVTAHTRDIVIESAVFNATLVRTGRRKLGISTEASYRFERGSGWENCEQAALRTMHLVRDYCGGTVSRFSDVRNAEYQSSLSRTLRVDTGFIGALLGIEVREEDVLRILHGLGAPVDVVGRNGNGPGVEFRITPPSHRPDWEHQADIAEELARFTGYDAIPETMPSVFVARERDDADERLRAAVDEHLRAAGFCETFNYSLCSTQDNECAENAASRRILVTNPVSREYGEMRLTVLPGLLRSLATNLGAQMTDVLLYERGIVYQRNGDGAREEERFGCIATGCCAPVPWRPDRLHYDLFFLSGILEGMLRNLRVPFTRILTPSADRPVGGIYRRDIFTHSVEYVSDGLLVAFAGEADRRTLEVKCPQMVVYGEVLFDALRARWNESRIYRQLPRFPSVSRDLSLIVENPDAVSFDDIAARASAVFTGAADGCHLEECTLFDSHEQDGVRSIAVRLRLRHPERTLTDADANAAVKEFLRSLSEIGVRLRGE